MDIKFRGPRSHSANGKKTSVFLPDGIKLTDVLPQFQTQNSHPEINLGMLRLAFRDLIEHLRARRVGDYDTYTIGIGCYGRYTVDLFYNIHGHGHDAHIDIVEQSTITAVIMLNVQKREVQSSFPLVSWQGELAAIQELLGAEIAEIIELAFEKDDS